MTEEAKRVLIVGAGAVGCFYGSRLHAVRNVLVSLVCRSNYRAIKERGVVLKTRNYGEYTFRPEHVFQSVEEAKDVRWDYVVVTTKALPDVSNEAEVIAAAVREGTTVVLIQNGVGVEEPYKRRFPGNAVLSAVTVVSAEQIEPGVIVQNRWTRISVGPYGRGNDGGATEFVLMLKAGGVTDAEEYDETGLQEVRWHKLAINAAMNPSAVLSQTENARMVKDDEVRRHLRACMDEVFSGAAAVLGRGFSGHLAGPEKILASTERNSGGRPSMLVDWERGAPMELEVILGNPIRLARAKGVHMPRLEAMYALLRMAQKRRDEAQRRAAGARL